MSENRKNNHEVGGDVFGMFAHKYCGREFEAICMAVQNSSMKNPTGGGKNSLTRYV